MTFVLLSGCPVIHLVRTWLLALALHQDDLPRHALLLPAHPHASYSKVHREEVLAGSGRSTSLTGSCPQEGAKH